MIILSRRFFVNFQQFFCSALFLSHYRESSVCAGFFPALVPNRHFKNVCPRRDVPAVEVFQVPFYEISSRVKIPRQLYYKLAGNGIYPDCGLRAAGKRENKV